MNSLINYFIKSDYVKALILAQIRHIVTAVGVGLVAKGYADSSIIEDSAGLLTALVSFWLASYDVKKVDEKITVALHTPTPKGLTSEQEEEVTRLLNKLQSVKPGDK